MMAQPKSSIADVWFYVNPETEEIDAVYCFSLLGITERRNYDWVPITREESQIDDLLEDDIYQLDWNLDKKVMDDDFDFDNYDHITPESLKAYDRGELDLETLKKYSVLFRTGDSGVEPADMSEEE